MRSFAVGTRSTELAELLPTEREELLPERLSGTRRALAGETGTGSGDLGFDVRVLRSNGGDGGAPWKAYCDLNGCDLDVHSVGDIHRCGCLLRAQRGPPIQDGLGIWGLPRASVGDLVEQILSEEICLEGLEDVPLSLRRRSHVQGLRLAAAPLVQLPEEDARVQHVRRGRRDLRLGPERLLDDVVPREDVAEALRQGGGL
eukprot:CAMPEP_0174367452 /NCGR_PEP_ID=MMETSP0811_2-20130205/85364_1 /TAXON_ID=73025 ORGANISM="Eutreptiella gymnastica-like, Strain CCMP1594" /NCGR_SAMPLE_ID=MMETSP0811_2 /ASSEMBLY_ACC=CAM_ASM_000667 /LENGTH=200 /DNA_ID=CAMNT_0015510025 /DNA_START=153 /DNA_END=753 /DNA_ORIENTATION=+